MNVQCDVFHIALPPSPVSLPTDIAKYIAFILINFICSLGGFIEILLNLVEFLSVF
jgi:hypothetical protein